MTVVVNRVMGVMRDSIETDTRRDVCTDVICHVSSKIDDRIWFYIDGSIWTMTCSCILNRAGYMF